MVGGRRRSDLGPDGKRKRGRPRKSNMSSTVVEDGANGVTPSSVKIRRPRRKKSEIYGHSAVDDSLVGQSVHGVLDGCFDAGYILSVRVGNTDRILRGVVFGPGLSVPVTKTTDVAPNVTFVRREEIISLPPMPATAQFPPGAHSEPAQSTPASNREQYEAGHGFGVPYGTGPQMYTPMQMFQMYGMQVHQSGATEHQEQSNM